MIPPTGHRSSGTIALGTRVRRELMIHRQVRQFIHSLSVMQTNGTCINKTVSATIGILTGNKNPKLGFLVLNPKPDLEKMWSGLSVPTYK
jgi:hypothetical protein